ncbi:MAG TPA: hypothetical protein VF711_14315 [Acidimicrobiales bacterium]
MDDERVAVRKMPRVDRLGPEALEAPVVVHRGPELSSGHIDGEHGAAF